MHYSNSAEEQLENIKSDLIYCRERIEVIRASLTRTNVELKQDRVQSSPNPYAMLDGIIRIIEFESELSELTQAGIEFIGQLNSDHLQKACVLFYIENIKVYDIARIMKYSRQHIYKLLNEATVKLSELNLEKCSGNY